MSCDITQKQGWCGGKEKGMVVGGWWMWRKKRRTKKWNIITLCRCWHHKIPPSSSWKTCSLMTTSTTYRKLAVTLSWANFYVRCKTVTACQRTGMLTIKKQIKIIHTERVKLCRFRWLCPAITRLKQLACTHTHIYIYSHTLTFSGYLCRQVAVPLPVAKQLPSPLPLQHTHDVHFFPSVCVCVLICLWEGFH